MSGGTSQSKSYLAMAARLAKPSTPAQLTAGIAETLATGSSK